MSDQAETNRLSVKPGAEFEVELEATPSSGAMWSWQPLPEEGGPQLLRQNTRAQDTAIGSPVIQIFTFRAATPGAYHLRFYLERPWESTPRRTRDIIVEVSPRGEAT